MSKKYVIEIKPEYEDTTKGVMVLGARESNLYVDTLSIEDLEELNSDYINEHFSDLQDTAYQKGFEDGKNSIDNGCKGCKWAWQSACGEPCKNCSNCYTNKYELMPKDEICFGDEIVVNGERGVVVSHENEGSAPIWALLNGYRTPQIIDKNNYAKTGRHFDIEAILEEIRK